METAHGIKDFTMTSLILIREGGEGRTGTKVDLEDRTDFDTLPVKVRGKTENTREGRSFSMWKTPTTPSLFFLLEKYRN